MSIDIKILKSSCCTIGNSISQKLEQASNNTDLDINLETLSDIRKTAKYGTTNFPSIVVDGEVYPYDEFNDIHDLELLLKNHSTK